MAEEQSGAATDSIDIVARLKRRMIDHALPLWSTEGWDSTAGGFVDRLDRNGHADRLAPRRVFVQARQIYCFAKAAQMGWYPEGREIALNGLDHLLTKAKAPDPAKSKGAEAKKTDVPKGDTMKADKAKEKVAETSKADDKKTDKK